MQQKQWNAAGSLRQELKEIDVLEGSLQEEEEGYKTVDAGGLFTLLCC